MLGEFVVEPGGRGRVERGVRAGLPVLRAAVPPTGWRAGWRTARAARQLWELGVRRVLVPEDFPHWDRLTWAGLVGVDPIPFVQACAPQLALAALAEGGIPPGQGTVALVGERVTGAVTAAAQSLWPQVRQIVVSVPRGGEELARWLREVCGMPVVPQTVEASVALCFTPGPPPPAERVLPLWGEEGIALGRRLWVPGREDCPLPLLAALWEAGKLAGQPIECA